MNRTTMRAVRGLGVLCAGLLAGALALSVPASASATTGSGADAAPASASTATQVTPIAATFNVTAGFTTFGQQVFVVGSIPELGSWNPARAVPLYTTASTFPVWTGDAQLPANTSIEFQYIVKNPDGSVANWEKVFQNRSTVTPPTGVYITHDTFGEY